MPERSVPAVPVGCALDGPATAAQRERYKILARRVTRIRRSPARVVADLGPGTDAALVQELVEVERSCCPFFQLDYDPLARRLAVSVSDPEHRPALEAIERALSPGRAG
jgi:hypothetical protein